MVKNQIKCKFTYEIIDGEVTITGYNDQSVESIIIPETIEGYTVTKIGLYAFSNFKKLITIIIPNQIIDIGYNSLFGTFSLKYINNDMIMNSWYVINNKFVFRDDYSYKIIHQIGYDFLVIRRYGEICYLINNDMCNTNFR